MSESQAPRKAVDGNRRFDAASVRRILERAAAEQCRIDNAERDTYSLAELEEMAAEAGISREVLRAAIERPQRYPEVAAIGVAERRPGTLAALRRSIAAWSPTAKSTAIVGLCIAFVAPIFIFPVVAQALFLTTVVALIFVALGATP